MQKRRSIKQDNYPQTLPEIPKEFYRGIVCGDLANFNLANSDAHFQTLLLIIVGCN